MKVEMVQNSHHSFFSLKSKQVKELSSSTATAKQFEQSRLECKFFVRLNYMKRLAKVRSRLASPLLYQTLSVLLRVWSNIKSNSSVDKNDPICYFRVILA